MNRWLGLGLLLIVLGALALRLPQLDRRPMHNDEAVNATLVGKLWQDGLYKYNPDEYHGPSLYYFSLPFVWLSNTQDVTQLDEKTLRLVTVCYGIILILLVALLADGLGVGATLAAGLLLAISPAMVFYSRYYIHEMLLVCFTMLVLGAGWQYSQQRRGRWALLGGLGLGLMYATKETFVIALGASAVALILVVFWNQFQKDRLPDPFYWKIRHAVGCLGAGALVSCFLFTSCFTNFSGPMDSLRSYLPWLGRAGGHSPHIYPFEFYLQRLAWFTYTPGKGPVWSEGLILFLALVGGIAALTGKGLGKINVSLARFLTIYTVCLTLVYSTISYKTPWCMLGFLHGMILLAGIGVAFLFNVLRPWPIRTLLALLLVAGFSHLGWEAWRASYKFAADRRNPYVFSQTSSHIYKMLEWVKGIAAVVPPDSPRLIKVITPDDESCWPLPWYFRGFSQQQIGYYDSLSFSARDFIDMPALASKLKQPARPIESWLAGTEGPLSDSTRKALSNYQGSGSDPGSLAAGLMQDFNRIIRGPSMFTEQRFNGVTLRSGTEKLRSRNPQKDDLARLNRLLFEDAYPAELSRNSAASAIENPFPVMLVSARFSSELDEQTNKKWLQVGLYELRPKVFLEMFVEFELWKKFIESRPRPREE